MVTKYFIDINGSYIGAFDGVDPPQDSIEVSTSPDHADFQIWDGERWIDAVNRVDLEAEAEFAPSFENDRVKRLLFEILFDLTNQVRVLQGNPTVTKAAYRDALLTRLKTL